MKKVQDILYKVSVESIIGATTNNVSGVFFDSRDVEEESLYVAQKGVEFDGHDFISQAIDKGAKTIICEVIPAAIQKEVVYVLVTNSSKALGTIASNFYDNPSEKIILVGVTGTNGKTTIASLLYELFLGEGFITGLLSTIKIAYSTKEFENLYTTPDPVTLNKHLKQMLIAGVSHCFMEVSSHGIFQNRIEGLRFSGGIFSNLTHDHLDYHEDFKTYRDIKKIFFDSLPKMAFALTNVDDKNGAYMIQNTAAKKYTYATKKHADFTAKILECEFTGMLLKIQSVEVWTSLVGRFNAQNLLAVYAASNLLELSSISILTRISELKSVEGRFHAFQAANKVTVVIDYAHTPDALDNVLNTINLIRTRNEKLITVLGCGGNRDQEKRPLMAEKASVLSDKVIFTSDNPRDEDPAIIIADMIKGVPPEQYKKTMKIPLREEAIAMAGKLVQPGDIVLIAGKGHEKYQEIKGKLYPFSDLEIAKQTFLKLE
ncbi:MAG: UDP-N-acetylmuramoyl-L-alanyl-D-glutamate--2,6-diaminopimelate ligase [Flavobacteriaceae bacterium]|jgi:UDP-N-acetylmuramoyl-L-alanyl-D-glutamate--2,6-diaminopimelate ligase|tara:strand:- start:6861 stop:8321 length:1461 start_codon:yes stop_codon:yes gene_type:complete